MRKEQFIATAMAFVFSCVVWSGWSGASAQMFNLASGDSDKPIEIFADDGIEWQRNNEILIARGNARAVRSGVAVNADTLRAYYGEEAGGGTKLSRLDAAGRVKIASDAETITGDTAVYDMEKAILLVKGNDVRLVTDGDEVRANRQMEYWETRQMAVARGNAIAIREGKRIQAETLVAFLRQNKAGKSEVFRVQAFDNVVIKTKQDTVQADKGVYNVESGIATLTGNVRINRCDNQFAGDRAEINLNTGVSKLLTGPGGQSAGQPGSPRVRGLLVPGGPRPGDTKCPG